MANKVKINDLLNPKHLEKYQSQLNSFFEQGGTWKELLDFDNASLAAQYKIAYDLYQAAEFDKASAAFSYLTIINPYEYTYWMGLAVSKQSNRAYEEAVVAYTVAEAIQPTNPTPYLNLAQCYYALQQRDLAIEYLKKTLEVAGSKQEYEEIKKKAAILLQNLPK